MALEGTFKDFGLADIFQLIGLQKKTGVLTVRGEGGRLVTVSFEKGMVVFADEFQRSETERLGNVLLRTRRLSQEQLARAMEVQLGTGQRLGYVLIERMRALALRGTELATAQIDTLRVRLLKLGAVITRNTRRIRLYLASNWPSAPIFAHAMRMLRSP